MMQRRYLAMGMLLACGLAGAAPEAWVEPVTGMEFVAIPKGCFRMGTEKALAPMADSQWERIKFKGSLSDDERPRHEVCVDAFWIGKFEVQVKQWHQVMADGESDAGTPDTAASGISWQQAQTFAERLTSLSGGKHVFRLPTEAEWEYACLGGKKEDPRMQMEAADLHKVAWVQFGAQKPAPVGKLAPNGYGLHDMLGNVWEWTADAYAANAYAQHKLYNPRIDKGAGPRVIRGASFRTEREQVRCAQRGRYAANESLDSIGLRLVRER